MPIYEYRCQACGKQFDKLIRSLSQVPPEIACPACQSTQTQRVLSALAVQAGRASGGGAEEAAAAPSPKPPVFGRKELKAAQEKKARLRDQALSGE